MLWAALPSKSRYRSVTAGHKKSYPEANLRNLMLWHYHGKHFTLENLPWLSILKEFKLLTPNQKRKQHKAFSRSGPSSETPPPPLCHETAVCHR